MIDPKTDTLWKTYLVYFLVLVFGIAIIAKIIVVQTKDNKELVKLAEQREYRVDTLEASRGNIFSADGQLMATTIPLYDVFFDYKAVDSVVLAENIDSLCVQMAELLPKRNAAQWKAFFAEGKAKKNRRRRQGQKEPPLQDSTEHHPSGTAQDAELCHLQPWHLQGWHHR